ncbi:prepilin peptidase [Vibrio cyclitrophicus]|nr:A24 family peptidase [Vibrio cyclitrophicus]UPR48054.1 prepilin peptidase [Vibrio cyclitrophicus]
MVSYLCVWLVMFFISFYDLSENRIPNNLLIILIIVGFSYGFQQVGVKEQILGVVIYFSGGLLLYFLKVMSAGDAKLLGVLGGIFGASAIIDVGYYIIISCGLIGLMYLFLYKVNSLGLQGGTLNLNPTNNQVNTRYKEKITMPFAPSVVIGLAMYSYFT